MNTRVEIPFFKGLNSSHTRDKTEVSSVRNVVFSNGTIKSRGSFIDARLDARFVCISKNGTIISSQVKSVHSPVEFGKAIYYIEGGELHQLNKGLIWDNTFQFKTLKIGETIIKEETIYFKPSRLEKLLIFSGDIFFCFTETEPSRMYFNSRYATSGNTFEEMESAFKISNPLYWKKNDYVNVQGVIVDIVPIQSHLYIVTDNSCYRFVGENAKNFSLTFANSVGGIRNQKGVVINDNYYYRSVDNLFYRYSGTTPTVISYPIKEELDELRDKFCRLEKCGTDLWIVYNEVTFVYDTLNGTFTRFKFDTTFIDTASFGERVYVTTQNVKSFFYDKNSKKGKDDFSPIPFETSFSIGYFDLEGRTIRLKNVLINVEEKSKNDLLRINNVTYSTFISCVGYSESSEQPQTLIPDSKTYNKDFSAYVIKESKPRFYRFKAKLKGRTLSITILAKQYLEEIQKVILELRVRGR